MNQLSPSMPNAMSEVFPCLQQDLFYLYTKLDSYKTLYCTNDEDIRLLDESAKGFFVMHGNIMQDSIMLSICALTDPASTNVGKEMRDNLTLEHLASLIPLEDPGLTEELNEMLEGAKTSWDPFRRHRNRRIGHHDLNTVLRRTDELLPNIGIPGVDEALSHIADMLNKVETFYGNDATQYHRGCFHEGDAKELMTFLRRSDELEKFHLQKALGDSTY